VPSPSPCLESESIDLTQLHDPSVDRVLGAAARGQANYADWESLDRAVMRSATYLPLTWEKTLYYRNPRLTNVTCNNALANGIYDFVNVGVR
jgi:peptide/nickel transport system substrate-binding protein